jgi:hypothetical protein
MMNSRLRVAVTVPVAVAGAFLAGCGSSGPAQTTSSTTPAASGTSSSPATPASQTPTPSTSSASSAGAAAASSCTAAQLKITYTNNAQINDGALDGMSHADHVVMLTNQGSASCRTGGYPGVAALDSAGRQIQHAVRSADTGTVVTLAPGAMASAMVSANTASCAKPTQVAGLLVTAPNQRTSTRLGPAGMLCLNSLQVGTLKPGNAAGLKL